MRTRIGVLFSGGLDSAALIGYLLDRGYQVWPVYVRSGLRWERSEIRWAKRFASAVRHPHLKQLQFATLLLENAYRNNWSERGATPGASSSDSAVFLPARNLLLLTKAMLFLSGLRVFNLAIATLDRNPFPDGRTSYFRTVERALSGGFARKITILSPFRRWSKVEVIRASRRFPIHLSMSCISPRGEAHCGQCNKCAERKSAFRKAGVPDQTLYAKLGRKRGAMRSS